MQVMSEGGLSGRGVEGPPEPGGRSVRDNQLRILALADKAVTPGSGRGDGLSFRALRECSSPKADRCKEPTRPASWVPAGRPEAWRRRSSDPCHLWLSRAVPPSRLPEAHLVCRAHRLGCAPSGVFMDFEMNHPGGDAPPPPSLRPREGSGPRASQASQASCLWHKPGRPLLVGCRPRARHLRWPFPPPALPDQSLRQTEACDCVWNVRCGFFFFFFFFF